MFEIEASRLALERSTKPGVKQFAEMMIAHHTKAGEELKATAGDTLKNSGTNFDAIYVEQRVAAHEEAVLLFTAYFIVGPHGALRGLDAKLLPTLRPHLDMIGALKVA